MKLLVEAIKASANHHGNECSVHALDLGSITDLFGLERDDERAEDIQKLFESLRHKLGDVAQVSKELLELIKYE
tara:strand:- start:192 stop:413 length:222 start_codon:yes stop_codon:yes gene_type:complete